MSRAAQTLLAGHMRPAGRVFETPALEVLNDLDRPVKNNTYVFGAKQDVVKKLGCSVMHSSVCVLA